MELLNTDGKVVQSDVVQKINEIIVYLQSQNTRTRGPKSERVMTDADARRVILGDLKDKSHKDAGIALGLSYGQVYSARNGFTFKKINKEAKDAK